MKRNMMIAFAASLLVAACSSADEKVADETAAAQPAPTAPKAKAPAANGPKTDAQIKLEQTRVQQTVEQAMADIPPELREKHQAAFSCVIEKNNKLPAGQQKDIGVDTIRTITAQLKANPAANLCA